MKIDYDTDRLGLFRSAWRAAARHGPGYVIRLGALWATFPLWRHLRPRDTFRFSGRDYVYFAHNYNITWANERAVEIPIILDLLHRSAAKRVLEVGNVLSHYVPVAHDVIDKFERADGVVNVDVTEFNPEEKYDTIVSVSTLEHVGWDEHPREPAKVIRAVEHLRSLLVPGGLLVATLPLGYNPPLDQLIGARAIPFSRMHFLRRLDRNRWCECDWREVQDSRYDDPGPGASGLVIGIIE